MVDTHFTLSGKALGGGWKAVYHKFEADDASDTVDNLGSEINVSYVKKYAKHYTFGIKYAAYSATDIKISADKVWMWVNAQF